MPNSFACARRGQISFPSVKRAFKSPNTNQLYPHPPRSLHRKASVPEQVHLFAESLKEVEGVSALCRIELIRSQKRVHEVGPFLRPVDFEDLLKTEHQPMNNERRDAASTRTSMRTASNLRTSTRLA